MQRPWKGATYWLAPHDLLSTTPHDLLHLLPYSTLDHQPRDGTTHNRLGPPYRSVIKNALLACLQPDLMEAFSQLRFPLLRLP